jgi:outer membrane lipase/esterase
MRSRSERRREAGSRIAVVVAAVAGLYAAPATAQNFSNTIFFGDSNSDSGRYLYLPEIKPGPLASGGAFTTNPGPEWTVTLGQKFGIVVTPSDAPGGGNNYAAGGARVSFEDLATTNEWSATSQIAAYLTATGGRADPNALYSVWVGVDDLKTTTTGGFGNIVSPPKFADITALGLETVGLVYALSAAGARYILVPNTISIQSAAAGAASGFGFGTGTVNSRDSRAFYDQVVWNGIAARGVNFVPADINTVYNYVLLNPGQFGITNTSVLTPACGATPAQNCGPANYVTPNAASTYFYADSAGHVTTAVQQIEADYFYSLLVAPSEMSFLAETAVQTTFQTINGIQQQIDLAGRYHAPGWNTWMNGSLSYLKLDNSSQGFPGDPGLPVSGTAGFDYKWSNGWLVGAALTAGYVNPSFSLGGSYTQDMGSMSLYAGYRNYDVWGDLVGTVGLLRDGTNRLVPIGITIQPNNGSTSGFDLSLAGEVGYDFHAGLLTHGPVAGFILQQARINGFTESGSFTSLSFAGQTRNSEVSVLGYQARFDWGALHPFAQVVWDHELDPLDRMVTASLTTIAAPSFSLPAVVLGRDWATATVGTQVTLDRSWSGIASFTAQLGQDHATVYGGLIGVDYSFGQEPPPVVFKK